METRRADKSCMYTHGHAGKILSGILKSGEPKLLILGSGRTLLTSAFHVRCARDGNVKSQMQSVTQGTIHCGGKNKQKRERRSRFGRQEGKKGIIPFLVSSGFNDFSLLIERSAGP
ncbi:hypothetical protein CDAR_69521 [Caerostris darwini]|uniref:Uncharacterized protein n=1 Tax=Caerostris darwini TaxID=1538125 RepID=A0AAV4U0M9_9ARAC|nr:hypothetical protein CDAR_69521 [Caerostris darwini]